MLLGEQFSSMCQEPWQILKWLIIVDHVRARRITPDPSFCSWEQGEFLSGPSLSNLLLPKWASVVSLIGVIAEGEKLCQYLKSKHFSGYIVLTTTTLFLSWSVVTFKPKHGYCCVNSEHRLDLDFCFSFF